MPVGVALPLFICSLLATLWAARLFARRLDVVGVRFGFSETVIGLLTALAADGPELASALVALVSGEHSVGIGVVVGSNVFNLAAMIGLSALLAGSVQVTRTGLALEGIVAMLVTLIAVAVLRSIVAPTTGLVLLVGVLVPYLLLVVGAGKPDSRVPLPRSLHARVAEVLVTHRSADPQRHDAATRHRGQLALIVLDVAVIVTGSFGMVESAVALGGHWGLSGAIIGVLVLAPLTSLPNAQTGVRLGLSGRGAALVSETFASNTINLLGGVIVPALFVAIAAHTTSERLELLWLIVMSAVCILGLSRRGGLRRGGGWLLIVMYAGFVAFQLLA